MITEKIKVDISDEFAKLAKELELYCKADFNIAQTKQFLQTHIPKEIIYKSEILLDTLLNYLMEDARSRIKTADIKIQNAFFDVDFRKRISEWNKQLENKFKLDPDIVNYADDPRLKQCIIASGTTFILGSSLSLVAFSSGIGVIIGGLVSILLSTVTFTVIYHRTAPKAREAIKRDINCYLKESQNQVYQWLEKINIVFENDFRKFCSTNGFSLEK